MSRLKKIGPWLHTFFTTRTVRGPWFGFQRLTIAYIYCKLRHQQPSLKWQNDIVIKNSIGIFSVNIYDDSFSKSLPFFEAAHQPWLQEPAQKRYFIDIGANIGFYSILATKHYGYQTAIAFEPNPTTYTRLKHNVKSNQLEKAITLEPIGLGSHAETLSLHTNSTHTGASTFTASKNGLASTDVPVDTFDNYCTTHDLNPAEIDLIKIDVEGFEYATLQGMLHTLSAMSAGSYVFIEVHPRTKTATKTHTLLQDHGFILHTQTPQHNFLYQKT